MNETISAILIIVPGLWFVIWMMAETKHQKYIRYESKKRHEKFMEDIEKLKERKR